MIHSYGFFCSNNLAYKSNSEIFLCLKNTFTFQIFLLFACLSLFFFHLIFECLFQAKNHYYVASSFSTEFPPKIVKSYNFQFSCLPTHSPLTPLSLSNTHAHTHTLSLFLSEIHTHTPPHTPPIPHMKMSGRKNHKFVELWQKNDFIKSSLGKSISFSVFISFIFFSAKSSLSLAKIFFIRQKTTF